MIGCRRCAVPHTYCNSNIPTAAKLKEDDRISVAEAMARAFCISPVCLSTTILLSLLLLIMTPTTALRSTLFRSGGVCAFTTTARPLTRAGPTARRTLSSGERSTGACHRRIGATGLHFSSAFQQSPSCSSRTITTSSDTTTTTTMTAVRSSSSSSSSENSDNAFFANNDEYPDFASLGIQSPVLLERLAASNLKLTRPTAVQAAAFGAIASAATSTDVTVGAETGSGKTLAYLLPLMDDILQRKKKLKYDGDNSESSVNGLGYDYARALILVPNKELVQQVVRMAMELAGGPASVAHGGWTLADAAWFGKDIKNESSNPAEVDADSVPADEDIVRLAIMPGGLKSPNDYPPFRKAIPLGGREPPVDLIVSTPASVGPLGLSPKNIGMFADIPTVVVDEADMLLDGGYIRQLENVFMGFRRADRLPASAGISKTQHVFVAATLPDAGVRSVDRYLQKKFPKATRVTLAGMHNARHYGLQERTVWMEQESKKARMEKLVELLNKDPADGGLKGEKIMVFLNSVDNVEGASQALERAGFDVLVYHAKVPLAERTLVLEKFRNYNSENADASDDNDDNTNSDGKNDSAVGILVCTDLAARGIDVPGVNAVVQLQMAGNVVGHLHRMGRCGRAGQRTGRGIVFYGHHERELVQVIREAEEQQERMILEGDVIELEDQAEAGKVNNAFSRKRGFKKKIKKRVREERMSMEANESDV